MANHGASLKPKPFAPRYREAYPYLDIGRAKAAFERGNSICEFTDRFDKPLGVARFDLRGDRCQFEYNVRAPFYGYILSWDEFELTPILNGIAKRRLTIQCTGCTAHKKKLFLKEKWRCASCHELSFRSQLIHPLAKKWETFDALSERLKYGKPHGIHNNTYITLLDKLEECRTKLYGKPRRHASCKFSEIVKTVWRAPLPKDDYLFPSIRAEANFNTKVLLCEAPLLKPITPSFGLGHDVQGDYETDDPHQM